MSDVPPLWTSVTDSNEEDTDYRRVPSGRIYRCRKFVLRQGPNETMALEESILALVFVPMLEGDGK